MVSLNERENLTKHLSRTYYPLKPRDDIPRRRVPKPSDQIDNVHRIKNRSKRRLLARRRAQTNDTQIPETDAQIAWFDPSFIPPNEEINESMLT